MSTTLPDLRVAVEILLASGEQPLNPPPHARCAYTQGQAEVNWHFHSERVLTSDSGQQMGECSSILFHLEDLMTQPRHAGPSNCTTIGTDDGRDKGYLG